MRLRSYSEYKLAHVNREANAAADFLAKYALDRKDDVYYSTGLKNVQIFCNS